MIIGIGIDLVKVSRIREILAKRGDRFLERVFTPLEQEASLVYRDPATHLAGLFAAKEAVLKALGTGLSCGLRWVDIEIRSNNHGGPHVSVTKMAYALLKERGAHEILVSISHDGEYAIGQAILVKGST